MAIQYFKRFRMEIPLGGSPFSCGKLPRGYELHDWDRSLLELHADTKYRSFRSEIDAVVFPCLGDAAGCLRLMGEITHKRGFLPEATWLLVYRPRVGEVDYCGTVQGICDDSGFGGIQNLGVTPEHRGMGLGTYLLFRALTGFQTAGLPRAYLEVTAQNTDAYRLYRRVGFRRVKTVYKAVDVAYSGAGEATR